MRKDSENTDQELAPANQDTAKETQEAVTNTDRPYVRVVLNIVMVVVLGVLAVLIWQRVASGQAEGLLPLTGQNAIGALPEAVEAEPASKADIRLEPFQVELEGAGGTISRVADFETNIPTRARTDVITYTVNQGDTLFAIADSFKIKPETVLFGNYDALKDNPHVLSPGMVLNILPTDGAYYEWKDGDNLAGVADYYRVSTQDIVGYSGNEFDLTALDAENHGLQPGTYLIIPGGSRPIKDWGPPAITRQNPASARYYGPGHCGAVYEGAIGTGTFVWPTTYRGVSGYPYSAIHPAIDIGGAMGNAIFAADSGVIVYAGWSNYGYGNLIVVDHGNGFQTAYAHLSVVGVSCGQSVFQGGQIGSMGSTGNSSGPHLHFELIYNGAKPNPLDYLQ